MKYTLILPGVCWEPVSDENEALTHVSVWTLEQMTDLHRRLSQIEFVANEIGLYRATLKNLYGERFIYSSLLDQRGALSMAVITKRIMNMPLVLNSHNDPYSVSIDGEIFAEDLSDICNDVGGVALLSEHQVAHFKFIEKHKEIFSSDNIHVYITHECDNTFIEFSFSIDDIGSPAPGETRMISMLEWGKLLDAVVKRESSLIRQQYAKDMADRLFVDAIDGGK